MKKTFNIILAGHTYRRCKFWVEKYCANDGLYIGISQRGTIIADVTVNISQLPSGLITVKNYSENLSILEQLQELGLITNVVGYLKSGFVSVPICQFNEQILEQYREN